VKIVIADDHRLLGEAVGASLQARGYGVAAVETTAECAVVAVALHDPDVCLLDFGFPEGSCYEALRTIITNHPRTAVVVFSATVHPSIVAGVLAAGALGCLSKAMSMDDICTMLDRAAGGQLAVEPNLLQQALMAPDTRDPTWMLRFLTDREWDVLRCITRGRTNEQIARELGITCATARTHVQHLLPKLGVHSRLEAAALMAEHATPETWPMRLQG
jgi:DNA-binding NarL/FixJ family response regulator